MIINGGARSNWRFFAKHLMRADQNERIAITEIRGLASNTVHGAMREMSALASGTRCKNFLYHANLNPRPGEELTDKQWEQAVDRLEQNLHLDGHSRVIVEHEKPDGRIHRHVIWSRIDPDSMTAKSGSRNYAAHERTARELERLFGHEAVPGVHTDRRGAARPERRPAGWETFRGKVSGFDPEAVKATLTTLWRQSDTGAAFRTALEDAGYWLCKGDRRDYVVVDPAGDDHSVARRIEGAKAADIRSRMADVDPTGLPTVAEARVLARKAASDAAGAETLDRTTATALPPTGATNGLAGHGERYNRNLPTGMREELAGRSTRHLLPERTTAFSASARPLRAGWQEGSAGGRTEGEKALTRHLRTAQRLCSYGSAWRNFSDRAALFAEAQDDRCAGGDSGAGQGCSELHFADHAGVARGSRPEAGSWVALIEQASTAARRRETADANNASASWLERIHRQGINRGAQNKRQ